ncbi:MAG: hypothetical protein EXS10_08995 [Phycisphaerales bacterium]|nr:hypothetical protein [Phycisphaerales bacterium]
MQPNRTTSGSGDRSADSETNDSLARSLDGTSGEGMTITASAARRRFKFSTLALVGAASASLVCLWSMRAVGRAGAATAPTEAGKVVESFLKERAASLNPQAPVDISLLAAGSLLPAEMLRKNPFVLDGVAQVGVVPTDIIDSGAAAAVTRAEPRVDQRVRALARWQDEVDRAASTIQVDMTLVSSRAGSNLVSVNGHSMRLGDEFGVDSSEVVFTVHQVDTESATFRAYHDELKHERLVTVPVVVPTSR